MNAERFDTRTPASLQHRSGLLVVSRRTIGAAENQLGGVPPGAGVGEEV